MDLEAVGSTFLFYYLFANKAFGNREKERKEVRVPGGGKKERKGGRKEGKEGERKKEKGWKKKRERERKR